MNNREFLRTAIRPMPPRDIHQHHRPATPLELLFDLVTVIAVAAAAAGLHHSLSDGHILDGVLKYLATFFALWLAWLNFTWFASAYDNDDAVFRLLTMAIMAGALTMAAGVKPFFAATDLTLIVAGFVIMRLGMVVLWLRAARHDSARRSTALAYALGISLAQCYWVALLLWAPWDTGLFFVLYGLGAALELTVPIVAERRGMTPWHRHHIMERYGLFNIIVLGETLLAGSMALRAVSHGKLDWQLIQVALLALTIVFALWWLYFSREEHIKEKRLSLAFLWGYGHLLIYLAGAAIGAGFAVMVDIDTQHSTLSETQGDYAVAIPVSLYLLGLWLVRDRMLLEGAARYLLPVFALAILCATPLLSLAGIAGLTVACVLMRNLIACKKYGDLKQPL